MEYKRSIIVSAPIPLPRSTIANGISKKESLFGSSSKSDYFRQITTEVRIIIDALLYDPELLEGVPTSRRAPGINLKICKMVSTSVAVFPAPRDPTITYGMLCKEINTINIGNINWAMTPGLFQLMFHSKPQHYTKRDLIKYKGILINTNVYKRHYQSGAQIKSTKAFKYQRTSNIIWKSSIKLPNFLTDLLYGVSKDSFPAFRVQKFLRQKRSLRTQSRYVTMMDGEANMDKTTGYPTRIFTLRNRGSFLLGDGDVKLWKRNKAINPTIAKNMTSHLKRTKRTSKKIMRCIGYMTIKK
uniref:DUF8207 domain-containing protein n=1 Tax=Glossina palpalis gambiensis TaxID=67801 RepID=A0A1B0BP57_9MUSC